MNEQLKALLECNDGLITNLSNAAALLNENLKDINWVGFYIADGEFLKLGPFQGKVACVKIPFGKGVCGTAAQNDETQLVKDVHSFPGHIACDCASNSEIVVPLHYEGKVVGVLDIDSPSLGRFSEFDKAMLEESGVIIESIWNEKMF